MLFMVHRCHFGHRHCCGQSPSSRLFRMSVGQKTDRLDCNDCMHVRSLNPHIKHELLGASHDDHKLVRMIQNVTVSKNESIL